MPIFHEQAFSERWQLIRFEPLKARVKAKFYLQHLPPNFVLSKTKLVKRQFQNSGPRNIQKTSEINPTFKIFIYLIICKRNKNAFLRLGRSEYKFHSARMNSKLRVNTSNYSNYIQIQRCHTSIIRKMFRHIFYNY